jgi:hypothetical protein
MKTYSRIFLAGLIVASLVSCKKENVSNGSNTPRSIAFKLKATNLTAVLNRTMSNATAEKTASGSIQWTSAVASANMIKLEAKKAGAEVEYKSSIQQTLDLFAANPVLGNITVPNGQYDEVEFKAFLAPLGSSPALRLEGSYNDGTTTTTVIFIANEAILVKGEKNNVLIQDTATYSAATSLNLQIAVQGITAAQLSNATVTNGQLMISSSVNTQLYNIIVNNLRNMEEEEEFHHD